MLKKIKSNTSKCFRVRIDGTMYELWKGDSSTWSVDPKYDVWMWKIIEPLNINTSMSERAHHKVSSLIDLLNKTPDYAGLTPQQFVDGIIKGLK